MLTSPVFSGVDEPELLPLFMMGISGMVAAAIGLTLIISDDFLPLVLDTRVRDMRLAGRAAAPEASAPAASPSLAALLVPVFFFMKVSARRSLDDWRLLLIWPRDATLPMVVVSSESYDSDSSVSRAKSSSLPKPNASDEVLSSAVNVDDARLPFRGDGNLLLEPRDELRLVRLLRNDPKGRPDMGFLRNESSRVLYERGPDRLLLSSPLELELVSSMLCRRRGFPEVLMRSVASPTRLSPSVLLAMDFRLAPALRRTPSPASGVDTSSFFSTFSFRMSRSACCRRTTAAYSSRPFWRAFPSSSASAAFLRSSFAILGLSSRSAVSACFLYCAARFKSLSAAAVCVRSCWAATSCRSCLDSFPGSEVGVRLENVEESSPAMALLLRLFGVEIGKPPDDKLSGSFASIILSFSFLSRGEKLERRAPLLDGGRSRDAFLSPMYPPAACGTPLFSYCALIFSDDIVRGFAGESPFASIFGVAPSSSSSSSTRYFLSTSSLHWTATPFCLRQSITVSV
eukprot:scaffold1231_cov187-Pinguiococcus_pyrenoidosus.AAC.17